MPDFAALEQKYGLPPGILAAQQQVESGGNPAAVSPAGARGPAQLMPATARALGVKNAHDPAQAAEAQAKLWRENLDATGGDLDAAAMRYHGGTDPKNWGPLTRAYPGKIVAALQSGQQSHDPFEAALSGGQARPNDPFEAALKGDTSAANAEPVPAQVPNRNGDQRGNNPAGPAVGGVDGVQGSPDNRGVPPGYGQVSGNEGGLRAGAEATSGKEVARGVVGAVGDFANAIPEGFNRVGVDLIKLGARGTDALGITNGALDSLDKADAALAPTRNDIYVNPNGWARALGKFGGEATALAPLSEVKLFGAGKEASGLAQALAKYGNYAAQGGMGGIAMSGGRDVAGNAALGAALGPIGGVVGEKAIAPLLDAGGNLLGKVGGSKVARMLRDYAGKGEAPQIPDGIPDISAALRKGVAVDAAGNAMTPEQIAAQQAQEAASGLTGEVTDTTPTFDPRKAGAAIEADAARRGIRSVIDLPPEAQAAAGEAVANGVPEDQAYREAAIRYVGAEPTMATSTRNRAEWRAEREGAKLDTPEGHALANRIADNNVALHDTATATVDNYGGVPTAGEATQTAAESLAQASDAAKAKVSQAYADARSADGDQRVGIDAVTKLLNSRAYRAPATAGETTLATGLRKQIAAMAKENGGKFSPDEIEELNQYVNRAYNPVGGDANHMVTELRGALNSSLDQFDNAGPAFKAARQAHRQWAEQYADPEGIAGLIKRDAQGNFANTDAWRKFEGSALNSTSDRAFTQIVGQLRKVGATDALNKLKAEIVQRAYEQATVTGSNETGHALFSGKQWNATLDKIGMAKLKALFSPQELAHLSTIGRAARYLNESVPGAENSSGTASALANALAKRGEKLTTGPLANAAETGAHVVAGHLAPGVGNVGVKVAADVLKGRAAASAEAGNEKALAEALKRNLDPNYARQAANDDAEAAADLARRRAFGSAVGSKAAAGAASIKEKGNR